MLRKLCGRGLLLNQDSIVTSSVKKEEIERYDSREVVETRFNCSLPKFVAAFLGERKLSQKDADELQKLIDTYRKKE